MEENGFGGCSLAEHLRTSVEFSLGLQYPKNRWRWGLILALGVEKRPLIKESSTLSLRNEERKRKPSAKSQQEHKICPSRQ